ncbi:ATP-binding cassette sub- B member 6, mitochondrial [Entomortierella chlamydospora]|uniref:ATP-binding cassette sub- B member 6, mitochondrial n=1 Tax=Entomortierella chlamydospora TaxID=101097 RepID=A0A9P6T0N6_9FUNG|nr:ATP-binding cassette sub- B member 6, mitochondrial [Entomortierella chlamydospora]KAG0016498.1 ATP-binding cassette sub- B member 6, mitochondrial [Entomortierella chlamydospora]
MATGEGMLAIERKPHEHHDVELLIPMGLLSFTILSGVYRYFFILRPRSHYHPLSTEHGKGGDSESTRIKISGLGLVIVILNYIIGFMFVASLALICLRAIIDHIWTGTLLALYNAMSFAAIVANLALMHIELQNGGQWSWANYGFWWLVLAGESLIGYFHFESETPDGIFELGLVGVSVTRYVFLWILALLSAIHRKREFKNESPDSSAPPKFNIPSSSRIGAYGTFATAFGKSADLKPSQPTLGSTSEAEMAKKLKKDQEDRADAFKDFWPKIKRLIRLVYPKHDLWLQFMISLAPVFMVIELGINVLVPLQTERVIKHLYSGAPFDPWMIILYVFYRYLQGGSGLLAALRGVSWVPVEQYSSSALTIQFFEHIHNLSLQFHLDRKTGELLRILDRGTGAIMAVVNTALFQVVPMIANISIAVGYFIIFWSWKYALIIAITIVSYLAVLIGVTEWRNRYRRVANALDNDARAKAVDSILNFETVKYYTAEDFEINRYRDALAKAMVVDYKRQVYYWAFNLMQSFVITMGMLAGCLLCAYEISKGERDVSHFVTFTVYLSQLYTPLAWIGYYYRTLQQNFVDMEKMIELLDKDQSVQDIPGADSLVVYDGEVVFENVNFQYDPRQKGLQDISFTVPKGKTVALVGPTGSGKSTILRLLFRFYDVTSGRILVDGQDISKKTQLSLRRQIGVVPQDSVLFNDSIYYNINYGRTDATKEEVEAAAKAAQIHDKIMNFPELYNTRVGERGLRLSGGEKQRVAIARTILKNPPIVLLDEATSALDSTTESQIQTALARMTENRTTLVIAHRLSTIVNSDLILCLKDGVIVEQGTHTELVERALANGGEGVYYEMWKQQIREELGESSTVDGTLSDDSDFKKGKGRKKPREPQLEKEQDVAVNEMLAVPSTEVILQEKSTMDATGLTQATVETSEPHATSAVVNESSESHTQSNVGEGSRPSSGTSTPKSPRKKKSGKKK